MQRRTRRTIIAVAVIALLAAGGAAFTNSIASFGSNNDQIGYASDSIIGATATNLKYALSPDNSKVDQVLVTLQGDYTSANATNGSDVITAMWDNDHTTKVTCTPAGTVDSSGNTVVTCDFDPNHDQTGGEPTGSATSFSMTVVTPGLTNSNGS